MARPVHPLLTDEAWLRAEYEGAHRSTTDISRQLGCSPEAVNRALRRGGIEVRPARPAVSDARLADRDWLAERWRAGQTLGAIAAEVGRSEHTVRRALVREAIATFPGRPTVFDLYPRLADRTWLVRRYEAAGTVEIAAEVGANHASVLAALRRHGIPVRSVGTRGRPGRGSQVPARPAKSGPAEPGRPAKVTDSPTA